MPEELNGVLTDQVSDLLFTHSPEAHDNLVREGIDPGRIHFVGNTMIDTLVGVSKAASRTAAIDGRELERPYLLVTLHRPALVDGPLLTRALTALEQVAEVWKWSFPFTLAPAERSSVSRRHERLHLRPPLGYLDFISLQREAAAVLTGSGGVQEETTS